MLVRSLKVLKGCSEVFLEPSPSPVFSTYPYRGALIMFAAPLDPLKQLCILCRRPLSQIIFQMWLYKGKVEEDMDLPQSAGLPSVAAYVTVNLLGCRHALLGHVWLFVHGDPSKSSTGLLSEFFFPVCTHLGLSWPMCDTFHLSLLDLIRFSCAGFECVPGPSELSIPSTVLTSLSLMDW